MSSARGGDERVARIVGAALEIIDESGVEALSMRTLAGRLNASTATIYRHFSSRAGLIAAVIDRVFWEVDAGTADLVDADWRQVCHRIATAYFESLRRHRNVALLLTDLAPRGPGASAIRERWLAALLARGFPLRLAAHSGATIAHYVEGFGIQIAGRRAVAKLDEAELPVAMNQLDATAFPATAAAIRAAVLPIPLEEEFAFGLELILDGLGRMLAAESQPGVAGTDPGGATAGRY